MRPEDCKRFESCSAPLCPINWNSGVWFPDEEICPLQEFCKVGWILNQKKIARKCRNTDGFFNVEMLSHNCIITTATKGLDPDNEYSSTSVQTKEWLKNHPEKRIKSESELEILKKRFSDYRNGLPRIK